MGYQYIQFWTENNFDLESKEVQGFLEKGAVHLKKLKDSELMMVFVKAFQSKQLMRTFLKSKDCLDELLALEIEWGNFSEAANLANMKGDVLHEADLLQMAGWFKDASNLILVYVLYNSLWVQKNNGWPLKKFVQKEELLEKAKTFAKKASSDFYDFICTEANILSHENADFFQMKSYWTASCRNGSVRGKMLCAQKFLDAYLPQSMSKQQMFEGDLMNYTQGKKSWKRTSVDNLLSYWNFWNEETEKMLSHLQGNSKEDSYSEFCMNYFGVRKQLKNEKTVYFLLYPDAAWVKIINFQHIRRKENLIWIDSDQFVRAAKSYWSSEMYMVGVKVLELLKALYIFSVGNELSLYCPSMLLIHIFKVSKSLVDSEFLNRRDCSDMLQKFREIPVSNFFGHIYPLEWQKSTTDDMVYLKESELSRDLQRYISRMITSRTVTSKETGMLMTMLLSIKFPPHMYEQIVTSFGNTSWKVFAEKFIRTRSSDVINDCGEDSEEDALVLKLHKALEDTDYADFSPSCFVYLLDRLLILVSCLKGYFFTTKSSLVEWLISKNWNTNPNLNFVTDVQPLLENTVRFMACTVQKLLCQEQHTIKWIKIYNLKMDSYPLLVLRLFIIICLLCINFGGYSELLINLLAKREVTSLLPWKFYKCLLKLTEHEKAEVKIEIVAEALKRIGNPLVIVNLGIEFSFPDAIFLNLNVEQHRGSILKALSPRFQMHRSCDRRNYLKINMQGKLPNSSFVSIVKQKNKTQNEDGANEAQWSNRHFWMMVGSVNSEGIQKTNIRVDFSTFKEALLQYILLTNAAMRQLRCLCNSSENCKIPSEEFGNVLDELQQLYSALCSRSV